MDRRGRARGQSTCILYSRLVSISDGARGCRGLSDTGERTLCVACAYAWAATRPAEQWRAGASGCAAGPSWGHGRDADTAGGRAAAWRRLRRRVVSRGSRGGRARWAGGSEAPKRSAGQSAGGGRAAQSARWGSAVRAAPKCWVGGCAMQADDSKVVARANLACARQRQGGSHGQAEPRGGRRTGRLRARASAFWARASHDFLRAGGLAPVTSAALSPCSKK